MSQARRLPGRRRAARHDIDDPPPAAPPQTAAAVRLAGLPVGEVYDDPPNEAGSPAQRRPAEHAAAQGVVCGQHRRFLRAADGAFDDLAGDPWRSGGVPMLACTAEEIARDILIEQARDLMPFGQNRTALARSGRRRCRCRPGGAAGRPPPWRWPASPPYGRIRPGRWPGPAADAAATAGTAGRSRRARGTRRPRRAPAARAVGARRPPREATKRARPGRRRDGAGMPGRCRPAGAAPPARVRHRRTLAPVGAGQCFPHMPEHTVEEVIDLRGAAAGERDEPIGGGRHRGQRRLDAPAAARVCPRSNSDMASPVTASADRSWPRWRRRRDRATGSSASGGTSSWRQRRVDVRALPTSASARSGHRTSST